MSSYLSIEQTIRLKYLTNYNIKVISEYGNLYKNYDELIEKLSKNFNYSDKTIKDSEYKSRLAIDKLKYYGIEAVPIKSDKYPELIKKIHDAPPIIYCKGNFKNDKMAAVVGSRKVSKHASKITFEIVDWLKELGLGIVSGLAIGIDTYAHKRALHNNQYTLAVLPNSLDTVYPLDNFGLASDIISNGGCLISEMIFNINRGKKSFVQRNRLQAALSDGVIPIEMGINSGTMHTIDFAKRYGKKVLLFKPTPMLRGLKEYSGIMHLINKKEGNQYLFNNKNEFLKIYHDNKSKNQLNIEF